MNESAHGLRVASAASISPFAAALASSTAPATVSASTRHALVSVWVATACQLGAAQLDASFGLADGHVHKAERALKAE
ncbi:hypothetical protein [Mycobacterium sp.]|uniref:hypothetical protein n=1 Tax=Mycobacterium sp. TaxID=1785 RepID=UPI003F96003A